MPLILSLESFIRPGASSVITRVSVAPDGTQGQGGSFRPSVSPDGRYVLFDSAASNLSTGDSNGTNDVFLKDLLTGALMRLSTAADGVQGNADSYIPRFSPDGRSVIFDSHSDNLIVGDTNNSRDIFRKDLSTGVIFRLSTGIDGLPSNGISADSTLSPDGRYMVFAGSASNLVAGDTNTAFDVFLKDLATGAITRVSTGRDGVQSNGDSYNSSLSSDGRYVVFQSKATNLVAHDTNGEWDIYYKDLITDNVIRLSTAADGTQANAESINPKLSANGRYVVFESAADNLVASDTNNAVDIFLKDLATGKVTRVSTTAGGAQVAGDSSNPAISFDGRFVAFESDAHDLVGDTHTLSRGVFRKDLLTGEVLRISTAINGSIANGDSRDIKFSPDGRYIVFESDASNLVAGDTNGTADIFWVDTAYLAHSSAIAEGRFVQLRLGVGTASSISLAWGDGTTSHATPVNGRVSFSHSYASTGMKAALVTAHENGTSWDVPHLIDVSSGQMIRNTALADTLAGSAGADSLSGDGGNNIMLGNTGNDILSGGYGQDILSGGGNNDKLYGGADRDTFVFDTKLGTSKTDRKVNFDVISDFSVRDDTIQLDNAVFKKLSKSGTLKKAYFTIGTKAKDKNDYLLYDADGSGSKKAIEFAKLDKKLKLTYKDFFIV